MTTHTPLRCSNSGMVKSGSTIVLLDPGSYPSFSTFGNETWIWNGTNGNGDWTLLNSPTAVPVDPLGPLGPSVNSVKMSGRVGQAMAFDGTNVMVYGGQGASNLAGVFQDTWTFNGTTWTLQAPSTIPYGRYNPEAAYLAGTGAVMFGGQIVGQLLNETWIWNGTTWSQVTVANGTGPSARVGHCMAASTTKVVMFGGQGTNQQFNDTWTFNGTTWTNLGLSSAASPSVRDGACMAWDSVNSVFVMFGGQNEYNFLKETWTFNPTTNIWTQVSVPNGTGPSGRIFAQMAFDTVSNTTIMFGGNDASNTHVAGSETWSFNAATSTWTAK
jgi:Kelch motif/Galactose oxidase, central domain